MAGLELVLLLLLLAVSAVQRDLDLESMRLETSEPVEARTDTLE